MRVTRQLVAKRLTEYLHGELNLPQLIDWAEDAVMEAEFDSEASRDAARPHEGSCTDSHDIWYIDLGQVSPRAGR